MSTTRAVVDSAPRPAGLYEVLDLILDKGLVIDAYVRVSLVGIELLTIDARIVIASVDTYLRFAEAVGRLQIQQSDQKAGLPDLTEKMTEGGAKGKTRGVLSQVGDSVSEALGGRDDGERAQRRGRDEDDFDDEDEGSDRYDDDDDDDDR